LCWGVPAVLLDVDAEKGIAKVDFGDGLAKEVLVGISSEELRKGDLVIVHAGVIISTIDEEGLIETYTLLSELLESSGESVDEHVRAHYEYLLKLSRELKERVSDFAG